MSVTAFDRKYRPNRLADVRGQGPIVAELQQFVDRPYSAGFLFVGESGIGKSSTAEALAVELNCDPSELTVIPSGQLDGEALELVEKMLRYAPMSGWRVVVFEEADLMTPKAEKLFLTLLESLPPRTVLIFTSNRMEWFDARIRLRDRLEVYQFSSRAADLTTDAERLVAEIWAAETGSAASAPSLDSLGPLTDLEGNLSFRRVVTAVGRKIRQEGETFSLRPPKQKPRSLLDACGPFGSHKPTPEPEPEQEFALCEIVEEPDTYGLEPTPEEIAAEFVAKLPRYTICPSADRVASQFGAKPAAVASAIKARKWA